MGYKIKFDNGHTVEFSTQPSDADIDEAYAHTQTLGAPKQFNAASLIPDSTPMPGSGEVPEPSLMQKINAGVEATANTAAGVLGSLTTGPLAATTNLINTGVREGRLATPDELGKAYNEGVSIFTKPLEDSSSELGKEYTGNIGKVINDVGIPLAGIHGTLPSIKLSEGINAAKARINQRAPIEAPKTGAGALAEALVKEEPPVVKQAPTAPILRNGEGAFDRIRREQGDMQLPPEPTPMSRMADELASREEVAKQALDQQRQEAAQKALEERQAQLEFEVKKQATLDLNAAERARQENVGKPAPIVEASRETLPVEKAWEIKDKDRTVEPSSTDLEALKQDIAANGIKKPITLTVSLADNAGYITDGNNRLAAARELGIKDVPYKVETTNVPFTPEQLAKTKPLSELGVTSEQLKSKPKSKEILEAEEWLKAFNDRPTPTTIELPKEFNFKGRVGLGAKQGGALRLDWGTKRDAAKFSNIPGVKNTLRDIGNAMIASPEEAIGLAKKFGDVSQNIAQKGLNLLTKGGTYLKGKVDNPVVHYTVDKFLTAESAAKAEINSKINGEYLPALRALSKSEYKDAFTLLNAADLSQKVITPEMMQQHGLSPKLQNFIMSHQKLMADALTKINEARAAVGKKPITAREAYSAMSMSGDYRKVAYKIVDGEKKVVGVIGADRKAGKAGWTLEKIEKKMLEKDPTLEFGPLQDTTISRGSTRGTPHEAFQDALATIGKDNPHVQAFLDTLKEVAKDDPTNYMGMQKHTLQKKGVWGMEGRKPWMTEEQNATQFFENQLKYIEGTYNWSHLSQAAKDVNTVLRDSSVVAKQPNAIKMSESYMQNALGLNPSRVGRAVNDVFNAIGDSLGIGPSNLRGAINRSRSLANTWMLSLNPSFLAIQVLQGPAAMPAMAALLRGRGLAPKTTLLTGGLSHMADAAATLLKNTENMSPVEKGAVEYAKKNHIYATDMVEHSNQTTKGVGYWGTKVTQTPAAVIEAGTRAQVYMAFVKMMNESGLKVKDGLFEQAHRLTDQTMNNYGALEKPAIYNALGPIGSMAYNLKSFGHNELSRWGMFAREISATGNAVPLLTQMAATIAVAGAMGLPFYSQWESLYDYITKKLGNPRNLTLDTIAASKALSENLGDDFKYLMSHGAASILGADISKRVGLGDVLPSKASDAAFAGGGKLADMVSSAAGVVTHPDEAHAKNAALAWAPPFVSSILKEKWYTKGDKAYSLDPDKPTKVTAQLNATDKLLKKIGITGINESVQKETNYKLKTLDKTYQDFRDSAMVSITHDLYNGTPISSNDLDKYFITGQGDPKTFENQINTAIQGLNLTPQQIALIQDSASNSITKARSLQRRVSQ